MDNNIQKIFTIHFPGKKVYIENTFRLIHEKMEDISNDKDHSLYLLLKDCPNPEIRFECYRDQLCNKKSVALKYRKDNYEILNVNVLPYNYKRNSITN